MEAFLFYIFGGVAVLCGILTVFNRNAIYSALSLIGCFGGLFFIFLMLHAHFLAFIHLMVYAGAIMVLFTFVIQLLDQRNESPLPSQAPFGLGIGLAAAAFIGAVMLGIAVSGDLAGQSGPRVPSDFGTIEQVGRLMFSRFLLPFEVTGVLLLAAMVGAVVLAKRKV